MRPHGLFEEMINDSVGDKNSADAWLHSHTSELVFGFLTDLCFVHGTDVQLSVKQGFQKKKERDFQCRRTGETRTDWNAGRDDAIEGFDRQWEIGDDATHIIRPLKSNTVSCTRL